MERIVNWIDETAGLDNATRWRWLERASFVCLILMTVSAPHSIAATQTAWLLGMALWLIRLFQKPRLKFRPDALDYLIWAFFGWSILSALFSYAPDISLDKLRVVALFLIVYFVYHNVRTARAMIFLAAALIFSAMFAVLWTPLERVIGRGVQIYDFRGGPFEEVALAEGDTILEINGRRVSTLEDIKTEVSRNPSAEQFRARVYHSDSYVTIDVPTGRIRPMNTAAEALSVGRWAIGRTWRASGFYGHYTTFAEVLQMVMSLAFGIFASLASNRGKSDEPTPWFFSVRILGFCLAAMSLALILTATRASQFAFLVSAAIVVLLTGSRKMIVTMAAIALPLAIVGLIVLQQTRGVGFLDSSDNSTTWRQTVYREGFELWTASGRNFAIGVGMDSIKRFAQDWRLFDDGRLPMGHFHSTPLQIAVERGFPALLLWISIVIVYLWRLYRFNSHSPVTKGIIIGILGGAAGFCISGAVHYNLGDSEVAMVFFFLMGLALALIGKIEQNETDSRNSLDETT